MNGEERIDVVEYGRVDKGFIGREGVTEKYGKKMINRVEKRRRSAGRFKVG